MDNRYNHHNRRKYSLKVHIVLVTKYRKQLLKGSIADDVKQIHTITYYIIGVYTILLKIIVENRAAYILVFVILFYCNAAVWDVGGTLLNSRLCCRYLVHVAEY